MTAAEIIALIIVLGGVLVTGTVLGILLSYVEQYIFKKIEERSKENEQNSK